LEGIKSTGNVPATMTIINSNDNPIDVYWINYKGDLKLYYKNLNPSE
jgi:hypothetical protein